jgi:diketogulonate reductase-like aldo/keto reductase
MDNLKTQGISMPKLGLGTFRLQGDDCRAAVETALAIGYRHIDTAEMYANEDPIGAGTPAFPAASCTSRRRSGTRTLHRTRSAAPSMPA